MFVDLINISTVLSPRCRRQREAVVGMNTQVSRDQREVQEVTTVEEPVYTPTTVFPGDTGERRTRKKSALAQQWEQKFGGNA